MYGTWLQLYMKFISNLYGRKFWYKGNVILKRSLWALVYTDGFEIFPVIYTLLANTALCLQ